MYTLHGQRLNFFEGLKVERQQRTEYLFVRRLGSRQTVLNRLGKRGKVSVIPRVEALLFDKLPESFNQVQMGRVGRSIQ
jgi:hypothetical protein